MIQEVPITLYLFCSFLRFDRIEARAPLWRLGTLFEFLLAFTYSNKLIFFLYCVAVYLSSQATAPSESQEVELEVPENGRDSQEHTEKGVKAGQNSGHLNTEDLSVLDSDEEEVDLLDSPWVKRYSKLGEGGATGITGSIFWGGVKVSLS